MCIAARKQVSCDSLNTETLLLVSTHAALGERRRRPFAQDAGPSAAASCLELGRPLSAGDREFAGALAAFDAPMTGDEAALVPVERATDDGNRKNLNQCPLLIGLPEA